MTVYLINISIMIILAYALLLDKKRSRFKNPKRTFCTAAALQWILLSGLRGVSVGADTEGYKNSFETVAYRSWDSIKDNFIDIIFKGGEGKDPGYVVLEKAFHYFSASYQVWLIFIAIIFTVPMAVWIYNNSENVFMSFLIYSCLFYSFFAITGHRQTIATGMVVFVGNYFIKRRKLIPFLIITLLMSTVHKSCLVFIAYYFIYNMRITRKYMFFTFVAMIIIFIFKEQFQNFLAATSGYESYTYYSGAGTYTFTILLIMVMFVAVWQMGNIVREHPEAIHSYNAMMLALIFLPTTFVNPSMMRVVQYFSVYLMILIPYILDSFKNRERLIAVLVSVLVITLLFIRNNPHYAFFWQ